MALQATAALLRLAVPLLACAALASCAVRPAGPGLPPPPPPAADAAVLRAAPPGMTRLYVLRPGISDAGRADSPALWIDGQPLVDLPHRGFTSVALPPGMRELSLHPGRYDARAWATRMRLRAAPGDILFLAVLREAEGAAADRAVTFEFMSQGDAMALLPTLQFVRPLHERLGATTP